MMSSTKVPFDSRGEVGHRGTFGSSSFPTPHSFPRFYLETFLNPGGGLLSDRRQRETDGFVLSPLSLSSVTSSTVVVTNRTVPDDLPPVTPSVGSDSGPTTWWGLWHLTRSPRGRRSPTSTWRPLTPDSRTEGGSPFEGHYSSYGPNVCRENPQRMFSGEDFWTECLSYLWWVTVDLFVPGRCLSG